MKLKDIRLNDPLAVEADWDDVSDVAEKVAAAQVAKAMMVIADWIGGLDPGCTVAQWDHRRKYRDELKVLIEELGYKAVFNEDPVRSTVGYS